MNLNFVLTESEMVGVQALNLQGQIVQEIQPKNYPVGQQNVKLDVHLLSKAMYTIRLTVGETHYCEKFIKE